MQTPSSQFKQAPLNKENHQIALNHNESTQVSSSQISSQNVSMIQAQEGHKDLLKNWNKKVGPSIPKDHNKNFPFPQDFFTYGGSP